MALRPAFLLVAGLGGWPAAVAAQALPDWVASDPAQRTVSLTLTAAPMAGASSAGLNGHRDGSAQVVVPLGWTVKWAWVSVDSTQPHSLVVSPEREKLPEQAGKPPFTNAMTRSPLAGLAAGQRDVTTFEADQAGWYWLYCGVPGHALKGEWIGMKVSPDAREPAVVLK